MDLPNELKNSEHEKTEKKVEEDEFPKTLTIFDAKLDE